MYISHWATQACIQVCPKNPANFNVDNVRVVKLLGGGLHNCTIVRGMVLKSDAVGSIKRIEKAKVTLISCYEIYLYDKLLHMLCVRHMILIHRILWLVYFNFWFAEVTFCL